MEPPDKIEEIIPVADMSSRAAPAPIENKSEKIRTTGNKVFDLIVYPTIAFGAVFAFSIAMLHTTKFGTGPMRKRYDKWVGSIAKQFEHSALFKNKTPEAALKAADNYISVGVSFAAGTLLIAPIKLFEDRRGKFSRKIDQFLDTVPDDPSHYANEPRQSWASVLGGRALTFGTIFVLATLAGKHINSGVNQAAEGFTNRWKKWYPEATPQTLKKIREWSYVSAFEGFYSASTAALLYVISRGLARKMNKAQGVAEIPPQGEEFAPPVSLPEAAIASKHSETAPRPATYIEHAEIRKSSHEHELPAAGV